MLEEGVGHLKYKVPTLLVMNKKDMIKPGEIAKNLQVGISFTEHSSLCSVELMLQFKRMTSCKSNK